MCSTYEGLHSSRCYVFYGIISTVEKGIGRFASKSPTWIIIKKNHQPAYRGRNMEKKRTLKIDLDELCAAMEDSSYEHEYYLNLETGEILFLSEYLDDEEAAKLKEKIDNDPDSYEKIPKAESHEGYGDMVDFIATVKDKRLVELLEVAINGKGAFRRFKDVLLSYAEERERWFQFRDDRVHEKALEWLGDIDVSLIEE